MSNNKQIVFNKYNNANNNNDKDNNKKKKNDNNNINSVDKKKLWQNAKALKHVGDTLSDVIIIIIS